MNDLFKILKKKRTGCFISDHFAGLYGYADDLFLISPSRKGLQEMISEAESYANFHNIQFSTNPNPQKSKTKGIIFSKTKLTNEPVKIVLSGNDLPWIEGAKYLGNTVTNAINGLQSDIKIKRAKYIEKNCEILQEFGFIHPDLQCKINSIYNSSFSGSVLWDFSSKNFKMMVNSWSISVRHMWNLPFNTHRFFIEPLEGIHSKTMFYCRFIKFLQSILKTDKKACIFMLYKILKDERTITGRNANLILKETNEDNILNVNVNLFKRNHRFYDLPDNSDWKINLVKELTNLKSNLLAVEFDDNSNLTTDEIDDMIIFVTTS